MCQLLAMSWKKPAAINFSFEGFAERGGRTGDHSHGWGIAFFEGGQIRKFDEPRVAVQSVAA